MKGMSLEKAASEWSSALVSMDAGRVKKAVAALEAAYEGSTEEQIREAFPKASRAPTDLIDVGTKALQVLRGFSEVLGAHDEYRRRGRHDQ